MGLPGLRCRSEIWRILICWVTVCLFVQFNVAETNCSPRVPYGNNLYSLVDHRPDYVIHRIPEPYDVKMTTIDRHIKKVFIEIDCAKSPDELFLSRLRTLCVKRAILFQSLVDYGSGLRCKCDQSVTCSCSEFYGVEAFAGRSKIAGQFQKHISVVF